MLFFWCLGLSQPQAGILPRSIQYTTQLLGPARYIYQKSHCSADAALGVSFTHWAVAYMQGKHYSRKADLHHPSVGQLLQGSHYGIYGQYRRLALGYNMLRSVLPGEGITLGVRAVQAQVLGHVSPQEASWLELFTTAQVSFLMVFCVGCTACYRIPNASTRSMLAACTEVPGWGKEEKPVWVLGVDFHVGLRIPITSH